MNYPKKIKGFQVVKDGLTGKDEMRVYTDDFMQFVEDIEDELCRRYNSHEARQARIAKLEAHVKELLVVIDGPDEYEYLTADEENAFDMQNALNTEAARAALEEPCTN